MAERRSLLSPTTERGSLVSGGKCDPPLLPYERQLVQTLGISEQEYRLRLRQLYASANRSPGYEAIPDIRNDVIITPLLISLAVGAVSTGISMLLMPKPKKPEKPQERGSLELPNETGRSRFNQTRGFQGAPPLATLGSRIPYIFGKVDTIPSTEGDEGETVTTGGIIAEPVLLWSRMESNGSFQTFKLLTSIGLGLMNTEIDESNVLIAGKAISSYFKSNVLLHHRSNGGTVKGTDQIYGDAKIAGGGSYNDLPYGCPDGELPYRANRSFCQAYSPNSSNTFGVSRAVRNGTRFSLNWELISIPRLEGQKDDPNETLKRKRHKIAGREARGDGMPGIGRWYNPLIGITRFDGESGVETDNFQTMKAVVGDTVIYTCGSYRYDDVDDVQLRQDEEQTVNLGDLNSAINTLRQEADNLMQEGEILLCKDVLLQVTKRAKDIWQEGTKTEYTLEVVGFNGPDERIGIAGSRVVQARGNDIDLLVPHEGGDDGIQSKGTKWFALMKIDYALANNTRACDVTEIGIKSQVFNQANGLCNFPEILSPNELESLEDNGTSISNPTQTKYMFRTSFFQIYARESRTKPTGKFDGYQPLDPIFAVSGNEPIDLFNSIRIVHPKTGSYSYKFFPVSSDSIDERGSATIYSLRARTDTRTVETTTKAGTFKLIFSAAVDSIDELSNLPEMRAKHKGFNEVKVEFSGVSWNGYDSGDGARNFQINQGFFEDLLGQIKPTSFSNESSRLGETGSAIFTATTRTSRGVVRARIRVNSEVVKHPAVSLFGTNKKWAVGGASFQLLDLDLPPDYENTNGPEDFDVSYECTGLKRKTYYGSGELPTKYAYNDRTYTFRITGGRVAQGARRGDYEREWDAFTRVKEVPTYTQLSNSSQSGPEHSIVYINEIVTNAAAPTYDQLDLLGLQMRSMNSNLSVSQISVWLEEGITIERLEQREGTFGPSHNFASILHWLLVHPEYGIGKEINSRRISPGSEKEKQYRSPLVDTDSFITAAKFMEKMPFRFDGAISSEVNLRSWATEQAQAFMCNMVMKNGRFCLQPAVPVNRNGDMQRNVTITALFTEGNILEDSFEMEYLPLSDRRNFEAVIKFRDMTKNTLANERTVLVRYKVDEDDLPQEDYDYTGFCTSYEHAVMSAKYLLSLRRRVDHVIKFRTIPQGLQIAPGDYIKVQTDLNPYTNVRSGSINKEGVITSIYAITDGVYEISVYVNGADDVATKTMTVKDQKVVETELYESLFALPNIQNTFGVYMIEEISIDEDGIVDVVASNHATTGGVGNDVGSKMVEDLNNDSRWTIQTS